MQEDNEIGFIDAEARPSGKEKITFREIVLNHLKKIGTFMSVEMRGGFWEEKPHSNPNLNITLKTYIIDTREVFSNSIAYLYEILYPHFDKKMKDEGEKLEEELEDTYKDETVVVEEEREDKNIEEGKIEDRKFEDVEDRVSYRTKKAKIHRKILRALCCFLKRVHYLKGKDMEEIS